MVVRRCPTLPHPPGCSTIGAVGLSFRVRNGTGRFPHAITTVTLAHQPEPGVLEGETYGVTTPGSRMKPTRVFVDLYSIMSGRGPNPQCWWGVGVVAGTV